MTSRPSRPTQFLIVLLAGAGVMHFARPLPFVSMVPRALPRPKELVYLSGAGELAGAALMAVPATRRLGGMFSAVLLAGVFPANLSMAMNSGRRPTWYRVIAWARLPLQIPLVRWAWYADR
ncbi:hypothetical protein [Nakamurella sp. PAMC28650]|jgi:uncharacterized membrane protein|uniref:DoxX family protein n=1 Tax=Nakamurella sp. PAMC28650 TaxID=2762325 RepID=UPI00164DE796|nr:hypothetical protein [Nakamurella sp. PAMC28650]QNK80654.1 hypothetical protein H7F38_21355 [Nakamurella sp. PAMC28650]